MACHLRRRVRATERSTELHFDRGVKSLVKILYEMMGKEEPVERSTFVVGDPTILFATSVFDCTNVNVTRPGCY